MYNIPIMERYLHYEYDCKIFIYVNKCEVSSKQYNNNNQ